MKRKVDGIVMVTATTADDLEMSSNAEIFELTKNGDRRVLAVNTHVTHDPDIGWSFNAAIVYQDL